MKKLVYIFIAVLCAATLVSCEKEKYGAVAGNDTTPFAVINVFTPSDPAYDADTDVFARLTANNNTSDLYYFAELTETKEARNLAPEAYGDYVIQNGTKVTLKESGFDGSQGADVYITGLKGDNTITLCAVNAAGKQYTVSTKFIGVNWQTVATGTYEFQNAFVINALGASEVSGIELQQRADKPTSFRFKNLYGPGYHLSIVTYPDYVGEDEDGKYVFFRIPEQGTGLSHKSYGAINVRDVGYWQGDDGFIFEGGYESGMYEDYFCFICNQTYVTAGNAGYGYDYFIPE